MRKTFISLSISYLITIIFIFESIKKRLHNKFEQLNNNTQQKNNANNLITFFIIPYVPSIAKKFKRFFKNNRAVRLAYIGLNKLNTFIRAQKDKLLSLLHSNIKLIVYKINCKNCDASYVGQTKRFLKTRINEH